MSASHSSSSNRSLMPDAQRSPFFASALRYTGAIGIGSLDRSTMRFRSVTEATPVQRQSRISTPS
ncbi:MAG: hypothetical protein AVDCRST_MAG87-2097 [uncultured Thermomicrobiales bacterium]|uniref:Uncharacterized protein n=1 Tax=uncultured Thermomicrobiales bacterium TaxID=1645740 RepID=A0A6J4V7M8_9BACT|nr:MAG: hypothetical protein AVDCRST_MAG87-2097 [uncultured Thermomicrobiales bacterium]